MVWCKILGEICSAQIVRKGLQLPSGEHPGFCWRGKRHGIDITQSGTQDEDKLCEGGLHDAYNAAVCRAQASTAESVRERAAGAYIG